MDQILEAGRRAPSAGNWQPWDFVVVTGDRWYPRRQASTGWSGAVEREDSAAAPAAGTVDPDCAGRGEWSGTDGDRGGPPERLSSLTGPVGRLVRQRRRELVSAARGHGVSGLEVFGSVARGQDHEGSDVDLLADLPPGMGLFGLARLEQELEGILGVRVEVIPKQDLKPDVRRRVEQDAVPL